MTKPIIYDKSDGQQLRINMISPWLKNHYTDLGLETPAKIIKLSIDGGFTCPNRDGSKGTGGCLFCSETGSGDMASRACSGEDVRRALGEQIELLSRKWPGGKYNLKYIAYFQSHTNTYAPLEKLQELFESALSHPDVAGIAIATRPDCIGEDVLDYLEELNRRTFMWVELGLQTIHRETSDKMNICCSREEYDDAVKRLEERGIRTVTHLILGLPGETREMILESVKHVALRPGCFGMKFHMLNVVKGSGMEQKYADYVPFETIEDYVNLLIEVIENVPPEVTIHRISADAPRNILIAPEWSYKKRTILNTVHNTMREKNSWQGKRQI